MPRRVNAIPLLKRNQLLDWTVTTRGRTTDNINLEDSVVDKLVATYSRTRIGRQELDGELLEDAERAHGRASWRVLGAVSVLGRASKNSD